MIKLFKTLFGPKVEDQGEQRTAFKTQKAPDELQLNEYEEGIANAFDHLPRSCRRVIERRSPRSWADLESMMDEHPLRDHRHP